jgi:hypothetical protein
LTPGEGDADHLYADTSAVTCVIKTNPGEHFSVMAMISTMISLDEYEKLTGWGGISHPGWLALRGSIGKEIDHGS